VTGAIDLPAPQEIVEKRHLLERIRADRAEWESMLARVPRDRLAEPTLGGRWSVKDTMAHITWGERENVGVMRAKALIGSELWRLTEDERNATVFEQHRDRSLADIERDHANTFADYIAALEGLSQEELNDAASFPPLAEQIPGWRPWRVLYDPHHYRDHTEVVRAWLDGRAS